MKRIKNDTFISTNFEELRDFLNKIYLKKCTYNTFVLDQSIIVYMFKARPYITLNIVSVKK